MSVDLALMKRLRLAKSPKLQIFLAHTFLRAQYWGVDIVMEGLENIPRDKPVFFAMNHTDRYNYWPFQYGLWRRGYRFTATWVKGKYFENPMMSRFMIGTNNIPLPSRGYVIAVEFRRAAGRIPDAAEYRVLRDLADGVPLRAEASAAPRRSGAGVPTTGEGSDTVKKFVAEGGIAKFEETFNAMIGEVTRLTKSALDDLGHDVLVFPQGTRSIRLSKGHTGLAQMSQYLGKTIIPVGSNGSEKIYPGGSPWAKRGRVVYRIGRPLEIDGPELSPFRVRDSFAPLSLAATRAHGDAFRAITDLVMSRIESLLDEPYRALAGGASDGVAGMDRLL